MDKYNVFLLTIGYGRTGSTLLGNILNNHPNCLVSNEVRFLTNYNGLNAEFLINKIIKNSYKNYLNCNIFNKNQKDSILNNIKLKKQDIYCIGDKKSGGNLTRIIRDPHMFDELMNKNKNMKIIINFRNPYNILQSIKKSGYYNSDSAFNNTNCNSSDLEIFKDIILYLNYSLNLYKKYNNRCFIVFYQDLIQKPDEVLKNLFKFLNLFYYNELNDLINIHKLETDYIPDKFNKIIFDLVDTSNLKYF